MSVLYSTECDWLVCWFVGGENNLTISYSKSLWSTMQRKKKKKKKEAERKKIYNTIYSLE